MGFYAMAGAPDAGLRPARRQLCIGVFAPAFDNCAPMRQAGPSPACCYRSIHSSKGPPVNSVFPRIQRLPPYVFNIVGDMKKAARARGEDIIDFGMGNPDQPTPKHIVDKLVE